MIYVPELNDNNCVIIINEEVIRVYKNKPNYNTDIDYKDYYPDLNYAYNEGTQHFTNYSMLPTCREATTNTIYMKNNNFYIIGLSILIIISVLFLYKLLKDLFNV